MLKALAWWLGLPCVDSVYVSLAGEQFPPEELILLDVTPNSVLEKVTWQEAHYYNEIAVIGFHHPIHYLKALAHFHTFSTRVLICWK